MQGGAEAVRVDAAAVATAANFSLAIALAAAFVLAVAAHAAASPQEAQLRINHFLYAKRGVKVRFWCENFPPAPLRGGECSVLSAHAYDPAT